MHTNKIFNITKVIFLLVLIVSCSDSGDERKREISNVLLYSVSDNLILFKMAEDESVSVAFKTQIVQSITNEIVLVRKLSPLVSQLNGNSLETICKLSESNLFAEYDEVHFSTEAREYISGISLEVKNEISKFQEFQKGENCKIGK